MAKKVSIGAAFHQWPKKGSYRKFFIAPPGYSFLAFDVDSQETKLMACASKDQELLKIYHQNLSPHGVTAAAITGLSYEKIIAGKNDKYMDIYNGGKVTNLSKNYRIGHRVRIGKNKIKYHSNLYITAHDKWGLTPTDAEVFVWGSTWENTFSGVIDQWYRYIEKAKYYGYAETLAGRRFHIDRWQKYNWNSESSAIMLPIQGSGADMKYLAIAVLRKCFLELTFWNEIHDEVIFLVHSTYKPYLQELCRKVKLVLDKLPFKQAWDWEPIVPFTWSASYGPNWKELKEVKI